ncbi:MAG TPA: acyl-CoA desaturase [Kofleriaceae bacterium]|nr:acyl-CoA desaturase [Kofleriaceae bacterium]
MGDSADRQLDVPRWRENAPFWAVHVAALIGAIYVGWSWQACAWLVGSYLVRMFAITAGYHRYFAHRTFKTSRVFQFLLALLAMASAQRGVLWWASHHRYHHKHSDTPEDVHSPRQRGFWWSHVHWLLGERHKATHADRIRDLVKYPELRALDRVPLLVAVAWGFALYFIGGPVALFWGHFASLVLAWHATFCINSLAHVWGTRPYATSDDSRNNFVLAVLTLGEGWHNNHHHYQRSARQGFHWWQVDVSYYVLKALEVCHIVWDVEGVPDHVRDNVPAPSRARVAAQPIVVEPEPEQLAA